MFLTLGQGPSGIGGFSWVSPEGDQPPEAGGVPSATLRPRCPAQGLTHVSVSEHK